MATIAIIDDEPDLLEAIEIMLTGAGFTVVTAANESTAYHVITQQQPQVILMDVLLSGADGREITRQLKQNHFLQHIPVIIMTAHPSISESARQAGASDVLEKPFEMEELVRRISRFL